MHVERLAELAEDQPVQTSQAPAEDGRDSARRKERRRFGRAWLQPVFDVNSVRPAGVTRS